MKEVMEEQIIRTDYAEVMQKSYIDYAMSVIVARALPDVRDGLKPVQRRTLYDMYELGIRYDRPYRKCARIVGDTMGKYHPHGDSSIYDALVVMSQEFKKGLPLVDGHGNFGSIEGDGAAAMRYTEARLMKITQQAFLADLDKDVVDFVPNFDETEKEPEVLPVRIPNLLVNGAEGIAVGMATSIPPHNLGEVIDAMKAYMKNNEITVKGILRYIKGPDFPTGGIVVNQDELLNIYTTGSGKIRLRGKVEVEPAKNGKKQLVITEIPYTMLGLNIGKFLNDVAALVETKKTTDITDISNQSSKEGIRIVLELKKDADVENLKNLLYKKTRLEDTFGVNMLAVSDGRPEVLSIKQILEHAVDFQFEIMTRKYTTLLEKETRKKEVQEGLIKACDVIDLIIEILRGCQSQAQAKECLMYGTTTNIRFKSAESKTQAALLSFTQRQAEAILEMRLYKLIGLEIEALQHEYEQTLANIRTYDDILNNYDSCARVIMDELTQIKKEYAGKRRTAVENAEEAVYIEKQIPAMPVCFLMDRFGYTKVVDMAVYERNKESIQEESAYCFSIMNTDKICAFSNTGKLYTIKVAELPLLKLKDKGVPIDNISGYNSQEEEIVWVAGMEDIRQTQLLFVTASGMAKMVQGSEFDVSKKSTAATKLAADDTVVFVGITDPMEYVVLQTRQGFFLKFLKTDLSEMKKTAIGVRAIRLTAADAVEHAYVLEARTQYEAVHNGRPILLNKLKLAKRDTKGTKIKS
ncbi:MAG: DNA topoisomerase (ATP-hydrolyzing) subunit A [Lachnospiraceae bacterium]